VAKLVRALQRLVDRGDTVVVIEHNLDVIAASDLVYDLGPEGGSRGGEVVASGRPDEIARKPGKSHTARLLREVLERSRQPGVDRVLSGIGKKRHKVKASARTTRCEPAP
jgi:excinuclease ABC subunit A